MAKDARGKLLLIPVPLKLPGNTIFVFRKNAILDRVFQTFEFDASSGEKYRVNYIEPSYDVCIASHEMAGRVFSDSPVFCRISPRE